MSDQINFPQLDYTNFLPQLFWLAVTFTILYFILAKVIIPKIASTLQNRAEIIEGNIDNAKKYQAEAKEIGNLTKLKLQNAKDEAKNIIASSLSNANLAYDAKLSKANNKYRAEIEKIRNSANDSIANSKETIEDSAKILATIICKKIANIEINHKDL